ncbi:IS21-like element helper ATPase IstB [Staphylococcus delphini]|uniref:IS21-like element helper ATPase IstB n=1 Tax=Staphylococcus delphini TaxID=53344 RepID=UPI000BBCF7FB|nr:IS21-like element helper ATPase IstB [Staphylococcus delphini]PCF82869.1 AAA family ATPase [Staphylococcus delphini]
MYTDHQKLLENFQLLNLKMIKDYYPKYLESLSKNQKSLTEILLELTEKEVEYQAEQKFKRAIKLARFPKVKYLSDFDFTFQPSINKQEILTLKSMDFLEKNINICFLGNSGVGKTHLAISLGVEACKQNIKTRFYTFKELIELLTTSEEKGITNKTLKQLNRIELLIIDEIGYTPISKEQADLFYQLMSLRYEMKSTIITTNIPFSSWGDSFSNKIASAAIIDRLIHHSKIFKITGDSYRLKDYKSEKSLNIRHS